MQTIAYYWRERANEFNSYQGIERVSLHRPTPAEAPGGHIELGEVKKEEPQGEVVITWDEAGTRICAVTRQDEDGQILSVIAEAPALPKSEVVGMVDSMPGTSGFTMAVFESEKVPVGTQLYTKPVMPDPVMPPWGLNYLDRLIALQKKTKEYLAAVERAQREETQRRIFGSSYEQRKKAWANVNALRKELDALL